MNRRFCFFCSTETGGGFTFLSIHHHSVLILLFFFLFSLNLGFAKSVMLVVMLSFNVGAYIFMEKA